MINNNLFYNRFFKKEGIYLRPLSHKVCLQVYPLRGFMGGIRELIAIS